MSFYQGPDQIGYYHYRNRIPLSPAVNSSFGYLLYDYKVPRLHTYGLFGAYQTNFGMLVFEGAYKPDRKFYKNL